MIQRALAIMLCAIVAAGAGAQTILPTLGPYPSPGKSAFYGWLDQLHAFVDVRCPAQRPVYHYIRKGPVGSLAGAGGSGTWNDPYFASNVQELKGLVDMLLAQGGNRAIMLRCGDVFNVDPAAGSVEYTGLLINRPNVTLGSWVDPTSFDAINRQRPPTVSAFTGPITGGWTQAPGYSTVYYRDFTSQTRPYYVRFADADPTRSSLDDPFRFRDDITRTASTGGPYEKINDASLSRTLDMMHSTAQNAFTLVHDVPSNVFRAYVRLEKGTPNQDCALEVLMGTGAGIEVGDVDGVRIFGIRSEGWGMALRNVINDSTIFPVTQAPPFLTHVSGSNMTLFDNCEAYYSGSHLFEAYANADGGTAVFRSCVAGWATGDAKNNVTMFVAFCPVLHHRGGNEAVFLGCRVRYGGLPVDSFTGRVSAHADAFFAHTGSINRPSSLLLAAQCSVDDDAPSSVGLGFSGGDVQRPTDPFNPATYRHVLIDCRHGDGEKNTYSLPLGGLLVNTVVANARFAGTSGLSFHQIFNAGAGNPWSTTLINCDITIDTRRATQKYLQIFAHGQTQGACILNMTNCRWTIRTPDKQRSVEFVNRFLPGDADGHGQSVIVNTEFYVNSGRTSLVGAGIAPHTLGFINRPATASQGGYLNCAFGNWHSFDVANVRGYDACPNYCDASTTHGFIGQPPISACSPALARRGTAHPRPLLDTDMDAKRNPRGAVRSIGPYEPGLPAEKGKGERQSIDPW